MKKNLFAVSFSLVFSIISQTAIAQTEESGIHTARAPKWAPDNGYWVVETNTRTPRSSTIYFYNNNHVLVYKETLENMRLNVRKRSVKLNLKKVLAQSLIAYGQKQKTSENEMLVVNQLRKR